MTDEANRNTKQQKKQQHSEERRYGQYETIISIKSVIANGGMCMPV